MSRMMSFAPVTLRRDEPSIDRVARAGPAFAHASMVLRPDDGSATGDVGPSSPRRDRHHGARAGRGDSGQVVLWTAFLLPILLIAAGLTFDFGNMINIRDELSGAVDSAALAGARSLHDPGTSESFVRNSTKDIAYSNQVSSLAK